MFYAQPKILGLNLFLYSTKFVCFLAFLLERKMEMLLQNDDIEALENVPVSPEKIQEALNSLLLTAIDTSEGEMFPVLRLFLGVKCQTQD